MAKHKDGVERFRGYLLEGKEGANAFAVLLGLEPAEGPALMRVAEAGVPYGAFEQFRQNTSLSTEDAMTLADIPRRTLTRRKREGVFAADESDRLLRAARLFARALELFEGNRHAAAEWLTTVQPALAGNAPITFARTDLGTREVERLIGRLEQGVFS